ncbi:MAG: hypothetical protein ACYC7A_21065 [Thermoanaerobaculia bacterium]
MKSAVRVLLVVAAFAAFAVPAQAQVDWGIRGGVYLDETDPFLGLEALTRISGNWFFNPNVEFVFSDDEFTTVNADVHYDFAQRGEHTMWAGAGLAGIFGAAGDDSEFGANLLFGIGRRWGSMIPYAQAKAIIADDNEVVVGGGIRF